MARPLFGGFQQWQTHLARRATLFSPTLDTSVQSWFHPIHISIDIEKCTTKATRSTHLFRSNLNSREEFPLMHRTIRPICAQCVKTFCVQTFCVRQPKSHRTSVQLTLRVSFVLAACASNDTTQSAFCYPFSWGKTDRICAQVVEHHARIFASCLQSSVTAIWLIQMDLMDTR